VSSPFGAVESPPLNAPGAAQPPIGVQPGVSSAIVFGHYVIIFGTLGGLFIYNGMPALGNPPIYWITMATVDPYGNTVSAAAGSTSLPTIWYAAG
jgi:hypothetical protein